MYPYDSLCWRAWLKETNSTPLGEYVKWISSRSKNHKKTKRKKYRKFKNGKRVKKAFK